MTNPGDIVRVRARRGGRASVYEANAWCQAFSTGLLDGAGVQPNVVVDMNVLVGGTPTCPDVVIATNPVGYRIALDLVGQQPVTLTAPASNSRISSIVAYTDDLALSTTENDVTGSPATCGLIVVNGAAGANPVAPTDSEIRTAITADGAAGSQASYTIIANVTVSATTTAITNSLISINKAGVTSQMIDWSTVTAIKEVNFPLTIRGVRTRVSGYRMDFPNGLTLISCASAETPISPPASSQTTPFSIEYNLTFKKLIAGSMHACTASSPGTFLEYNYFGPTKTDSYINKTTGTPLIIDLILLGRVT